MFIDSVFSFFFFLSLEGLTELDCSQNLTVVVAPPTQEPNPLLLTPLQAPGLSDLSDQAFFTPFPCTFHSSAVFKILSFIPL